MQQVFPGRWFAILGGARQSAPNFSLGTPPSTLGQPSTSVSFHKGSNYALLGPSSNNVWHSTRTCQARPTHLLVSSDLAPSLRDHPWIFLLRPFSEQWGYWPQGMIFFCIQHVLFIGPICGWAHKHIEYSLEVSPEHSPCFAVSTAPHPSGSSVCTHPCICMHPCISKSSIAWLHLCLIHTHT